MKSSASMIAEGRAALVPAAVASEQTAGSPATFPQAIPARHSAKLSGPILLLAGMVLLLNVTGCVSQRERNQDRPWNSPDFMDRNRHTGDPGLEGRGFWNTPANRKNDLW